MSLQERLTLDNPVLTKELRVRMRGTRGYWIMMAYLGFLSIVMLGMYGGWLNQNQNYASSSAAQLGLYMYMGIYMTQIFLVLFITPAITSGALTIEREQQTSEMLQMTRMSSGSIVAGKLFSAVAFTGLLLLTSLPLVSICFTMGSVDPMMVLNSYLMMLAGSILLGAMGLMWSSIAKTTAQAVMYTYMSMIGAFVIVFCGLGFSQGGSNGDVASNICSSLGATWFGGKTNDSINVSSFGFIVMCLLLGLILATVAASRIEMWPERKGGVLRGLTALAVGLQFFAVSRWWFHAMTQGALGDRQYVMQPPIATLILPACLLMLLVPVFCTGEFAPHELRRIGKTLLEGWKPGQLKRGAVASGTPFMLLLTLVSLGVFVISVLCYGHFGASQANSIANVPIESLIGGGIVLAASVFGFGMFCQFLSAILNNRWASWLLGTGTLVLIWLVPFIAINSGVTYAQGVSVHHLSPLVHLFYLNPAFMIVALTNSANLEGFHSALGISLETMIGLSVSYWLLIAAVSLIGTHIAAGFSTKRAAPTGEKAVA